MRLSLNVWFIRLIMASFWIAIISLFLMLPRLTYFFSTSKSITVFAWPLLLDPVYIKKFEQETGIKVYIAYFESGASMLAKMEATGGYGYDLVIPDDHYVDLLIQKNLVKKLDRSQLQFWDSLYPQLLNPYFDPENRYSIPYYWGVYGIGYNKKIDASVQENAWKVLYRPANGQGRICMTDDPREAILLTTLYLYGSIDALAKKEVQEHVKQVLIEQKKYVEIYTTARADSLLNIESCNAAAIISPELYRVVQYNQQIDFFIPRNASFLVIDSITIPKTTIKDEYIYQFVNFLYRPETIEHHHKKFGFCSPIKNINRDSKYCPIDSIGNFSFFKNVISDEEFNQLWIEILAA